MPRPRRGKSSNSSSKKLTSAAVLPLWKAFPSPSKTFTPLSISMTSIPRLVPRLVNNTCFLIMTSNWAGITEFYREMYLNLRNML